MFESRNLVKHSKYELWNPLKKLLDTSDDQFGKTEVIGLTVVVDFMSVIHKTGFEKHTKVKGGLTRVWDSVLAQSNTKIIEIVYDRYLENSIKESLGMFLDSPVPSEINKFWASSISEETPTISAKILY